MFIASYCRYFRGLKSISSSAIRLNRIIGRSVGSNSSAYDGDGKTVVRVLNDEEPNVNMINTYSAHGFRLQNKLFVRGSILLFPTHVYSWNVKRGVDITPESLMVFDLIVPKIKILVIGYGEKGEPYDASLPLHLKNRGISCELLPTENAVTTYNYLVADAVHVAGAFVPVKDDVIMETKDIEALQGQPWLKAEDQYLQDPIDDRPLTGREKEKRLGGYKKKKTFDDDD